MPRRRRTPAQIQAIKDAICDVLARDCPQTVRQVFYQLASRLQIIPKTENEYKNTVVRLLKELRLNGTVPWSWITDSSRSFYQARTTDSMKQTLQDTLQVYRRNLLDTMDRRVEIWLEKEALVGVIQPETHPWGVPLYPCRGYASLSFLHDAAETIAGWWDDRRQATSIYYFGDHDPSGVDISRAVEERLREFVYAEVTTGFMDDEGAYVDVIRFKRVAVEPWQINEWNLPTRPTKMSDSRSKNFVGDSVELDAIPSNRLREMVRDCIKQHVDPYKLEKIQQTERLERKTLETLIESLSGNGLDDVLEMD